MEFFYKVCYYLIVGISLCESARILGIFPIPGKSHFTWDNSIMKPLIDAGHEVTVITSFPEDAKKHNYTKIIDASKYTLLQVGRSHIMDFIKMTSSEMLLKAITVEQPLCEKVIKSKEIQDIMNSKEKLYDVVFVEMFVMHKCFYPVAQKLGIPLIGTVSLKIWLYTDWAIDNPIYPSYMPLDMISSWRYNNFYQRLLNTYHYAVMKYFWYHTTVPELEKFYNENLKHVMSYSEFMSKEPDFLFYNNHQVFYPRPMNPNVAQIGGIHVEPAKPLPKQIQNFIDGAKNGVILFSFGSIVKTSSLPFEMIQIFKDALAELPQRVIWKFEDKLDNMPENVLPLEWIPQRDILEHKNVIAFMSHCGQAGTYEAIYTGTPVVSCSLFGDQPGNAALLEHLEVAVHLDIHTITKESILSAINAVVNNTKYRENMQKLSQQFKNQPLTPQELVVYWTEYIIRHNGAHHLKTAASQLNWFQYLLLDVLIFIFLSTATIIYLIYRLIKSTYHFIVKKDKIVKNKSD